MEYSLKNFGIQLKALRKNLGLTQDNVVQMTNGCISRPTLQRYETGKYKPSIETLSILSSVYQIDLYEYFYTWGQSQHMILRLVEETLKKNLDLSTSKQLLRYTNLLLKTEECPSHLYSYYSRISMLAKGVYLKNIQNYRKANYFLLKALRLRFPHFSLTNYSDFIYFSLDYRILCNFMDSLVCYSARHIAKAIKVYQFMVKNCPSNYPVYPQICIELGFLYLETSLYKEAEEIFQLAISSSQKHLNYRILAQLYYGKAIAEHFLHSKSYVFSLYTSYTLAQSFGNKEFQDWLIQTSQEVFSLNLPHTFKKWGILFEEDL